MTPYIPAKTVEEINGSHPKGTRHETALKIAIPLIGNGLPAEAVFATLRSKFDTDVTDKELEDIVRWAISKNPTPSGYGTAKPHEPWKRSNIQPPAALKRSPEEHARWWLSGAEMDQQAFGELSQLKIQPQPGPALELFFEMLYDGAESINIICQFLEDGEKAKPHGAGKILTRDGWLEYLRKDGVPQSKAGAWIRPNPCRGEGSGHSGAVTDSDITAHRFLLIESDVLPLRIQFALFSKIKLPIAAVILSGGVSAHAWVRLDSKNAEEYSQTARRILSALEPFGIDQCNKNPSRMSRLPCAKREIGARGDGQQSLLWLNPAATGIIPAELKAFYDSTEIPAIEERPFRSVILDAIPRYEYLLMNKGALGVKTGLPTFDNATGGWKPATMTILAADTGRGKTTLALNFINTALLNNVGVACFSMEMTKEDICDMLFSLNARVDRNKFNTGEFSESDIKSMTVRASTMAKWPLWVDDASTINVDQIRKKTLQLKADGRIGLVVVDYAQLVSPENSRDSREQQVAQIGRGLRVLAKDSMLPILVLSQLNDDGKIRESRVLAHEAANVMLIRTESGQMNDPNLVLETLKGRKIPANPIKMRFEPEYCRITEISGSQTTRYPIADD